MRTKWRTTVSIATILAAYGCYQQEEPLGESSDTDAVTASASNSGGTDGPTSDGSGSDSSDPDSGGDTDGGDDTDTDGDDTEEPADGSDLEGLIGSLCAWDFQCCSRGELDFRLGPFTTDAEDCHDRYVEQLYSNNNIVETQRGDLLSTLAFAVRLDRSEPNPDMVQACQELIEHRSCNEPYDGDVYCEPGDDPVENPCDLRNLFTGRQQVGEPCSEALSTLGFDIECIPGSSCEPLDGTFVCVQRGLVDEFCDVDGMCDEGLFCDISVGRCAEKSNVNEPCAFANDDEPDSGSETIPCKEHLTCNPDTNTCVQYCSEGYDCWTDEQCPQGHSCIPVDIGDNTYTYCLSRGDTNGDRCDTDHDCIDSFHCAGGSCAADRTQGTDCTTDNQCQAGLYCDLVGSGQCEIVLNANALCTDTRQCNPSTTLGCMTGENGSRCRTALLPNGSPCVPGENDGGTWCASGVCEDITDDLEYNPECHPGAQVSQSCDDSPSTFDIRQCAQGLYCDEGFCQAKLDAGGDCRDDGAEQCLNGMCTPIWEGEYCSDAVAFEDIDTAATCDGVG
jgi:hypothetical protein